MPILTYLSNTQFQFSNSAYIVLLFQVGFKNKQRKYFYIKSCVAHSTVSTSENSHAASMVTLIGQVQGSQSQVVSEGQLGPSVDQNSDIGLVPVFSCHVQRGPSLPTWPTWSIQVGSGLSKKSMLYILKESIPEVVIILGRGSGGIESPSL